MTYFIKLLKSDLLKLNGSFIFSIVLIFPFIIVILANVLTYSICKSTMMIEGINPWMILARYLYLLIAFMLPIILSLLSYQVNMIEIRSNGYRQLFTMPFPKILIYFSKISLLVILLICIIIVIFCLNVVSGFVLQQIKPILVFNKYFIFDQMTLYYVKLFVTMLSIVLIQFNLSFFIRNILISTGLPLILIILGVFISTWDYIYLFPFAYGFNINNEFIAGINIFFTLNIISGIVYVLIFMALGLFLTMRINRFKGFFN